MRTMTRSTAELDVNPAFDTNNVVSYLLLGGGVVALVAAVIAAIAV